MTSSNFWLAIALASPLQPTAPAGFLRRPPPLPEPPDPVQFPPSPHPVPPQTSLNLLISFPLPLLPLFTRKILLQIYSLLPLSLAPLSLLTQLFHLPPLFSLPPFSLPLFLIVPQTLTPFPLFILQKIFFLPPFSRILLLTLLVS